MKKINNFVQFCNPNLIFSLVKNDNILPLEFLLNKEGQQLEKLQKLKQEGKLDFGSKKSKRDLSSLFPDIKEEVDSFLGVTGIDAPKYNYFNLFSPSKISAGILLGYAGSISMALLGIYGVSKGLIFLPAFNFLCGLYLKKFSDSIYSLASQPGYNNESKSITLLKEKRAKLIPIIAHEYAHHVQRESELNGELESILLNSFLMFREGHARGVERDISKVYREKEDNEAFLYDITDRTFGELKSAYLWTCKLLGIPFRKSLLNKKTSVDKIEDSYRSRLKFPTPHAIGNTLFYLYETLMGNKIYKDMLNGTFKHPPSCHWQYFI